MAIAIELFFDNLEAGLNIHDALETDMALRAAIAVSADLGNAINDASDLLDDGMDVADIEIATADTFEEAFEEAATVIIYLAELVSEEALILDAAIE